MLITQSFPPRNLKRQKQCYGTSVGLKGLAILWTKKAPVVNQKREHFGNSNFQALGHLGRTEVTIKPGRKHQTISSLFSAGFLQAPLKTSVLKVVSANS